MNDAGTDMRLAVFASGSGTNFQAILDALDRGELDINVAMLLTGSEESGAAQRARSRSIPVAVHTPNPDPDREADALLSRLAAHEANFIALAGYMRLIPTKLVSAFRGRMLNVHPALLPAFGGKGMYGMNVHRAAIAYGVRWSGATVHLVDETYDTGPIVLQKPVPVHHDDTPEALAARIREVEHRLYPEALRLFAEHRVTLEGRRVIIHEKSDRHP